MFYCSFFFSFFFFDANFQIFIKSCAFIYLNNISYHIKDAVLEISKDLQEKIVAKHMH